MKNRRLLILTSIVLGAAIAPSAFGNTDLFWDSDAGTTAATGGTGTWNLSGPLWRSGTSTGTLQTYDNTAPSVVTVQIGGTAGTLTIAADTTLNVNKIATGTTGYTVAGANATTSVLNLSGAAPAIVGNGTTYFTSKLTGTAGFALSGGSFNVFAGDLSGLAGTVSVGSRGTLQGIAYGTGNGAFALSGSQFQAWNVTNILTSNNHGTGTTIQLGALSGSGTVRCGNDNTAPGAAGDDIFQVGGLNTDTSYAGVIQDFNATSITGLTKVGSGSLTLSGTLNSYTGGTLVSAGTLNVTGSLTGASAGISSNGSGIATNGTGILTQSSSGTISGAKTFTQGSSGTSVLAGSISYTGATTISAGALTLTGTSGTGTIGAINLTGASGTLNIGSTGTLKAASISQGTAATDAGVVNQSAGTLTLSGDIALGNAGGYGAYAISGGTLNVVSVRGGSVSGGGNGSSYIYQTGGTLNVSSITTLNRNGTGTSVLNIAGAGAVFNQALGGSNLNLGYAAGGTGIVTVSAGSLAVNTSIVFNNNGANGILNLNGGTIRANDISLTTAVPAVSGISVVNLNGGILKANVDKTTFMTGLTMANVCAGGANIDTNGKTITIGQPFLGTAGTTGVSNIPVASGGSGYLAAPVVTITGDGTGASAVATLTGGVVSDITITSAGTGYTVPPTVALVGGGATTAATLGTVAINANAADGGLIKTGAGTLILSGGNTYSGPTVVNGGTLQAGQISLSNVSGSFGLNSAVTLADAANTGLALDAYATQIGSLTGGGTTGGGVALGIGTLTVGGDSTSPAPYAGAISGGGGLIKIGSGTQILAGNNTYSGSTLVDAGTLTLASTGHLSFFVNDANSNAISGGGGSLVLGGSLTIDTSAVTVSSGTWTLVDVPSLGSVTFGAAFSPGPGWVEATTNVWQLTDGAKTWTFTEATGALTLSTSAIATYATWIGGFFPGETNPAIIGAGSDPDQDGISNGVEMVVGGNPATGMDSALLPTSELAVDPAGVPAGSYLLFTYRRTDLSVAASVACACEYGTNLDGTWTSARDGVNGVTILVDDNYASFSPAATNTDRVRVFIPCGVNTKLFARLNASIP